ncbi:hypothetical protein [Ochrobactrum chromiisoli]|uniref:Uncharacterized protein n=1 Tax=Ochrobactrum chromiisoli TaxID=2993941 RepID=A0ABT3QKZ1_9HYPH|nr:hypothetical protein [Ochrobactrum chromiisoli]MCX2696264.1 hypothetical protein [Ochrobactrum chromiisoli]
MTYNGRIGLFKFRQKYSTSDRYTSVSKGCLHLFPDALSAIGLQIGNKYTVEKGDEEGLVIVRHSKSPTAPVLKEPEAIRFQPTFVLEFLGNNARISAQDMPLTDITFEASGDKLIGRLPESVKTSALQARKQQIADDGDFRDVIRGYSGAAAAIVLEAHRYGMKDTPIALDQMVFLLRDEGHRVSQINERLWRLDESTATLGDLIQLARKYEDGLVLVAA